MNNIIKNLVQEEVDFIPDYEKIKGKINTSKYIKKMKFETKKKNYWKLATISVSTLLVILIIPIIMIINNLPGQHPEEIPNIDKIENIYFDKFLRIEPRYIFQNDTDTIVFNVEVLSWAIKQLKSLYIKGNTLEIVGAEAFAESLKAVTIDNEKYYFIDLVATNTNTYMNFYLVLNFEKNSCSENIVYSDIVKYNIIAHSFDIYINYGYEESAKQNLRFYYDVDDIYGNRISFYNKINDLLDNSYFKELYLPDLDKYNLSKELIYYPNNKSVAIRSSNFYRFSVDVSKISFELGVRISDTGIMYGDQPKIPYSYNGLDYMIIVHEASVTIEYSVDFSIKNEETNETIQYSYLIKASSIDKVKEFIRDISLYTVL